MLVDLNNTEPHLCHSNGAGILHSPNSRGRLVWSSYICRTQRSRSTNPDVLLGDGCFRSSQEKTKLFFEALFQMLYSRHLQGLCTAVNWHPELVRSDEWGIWKEKKKRKSTVYGTFKKRRGRRKGKKHHCVAKGLRLRIPLCNLTVFNSYILMPRRPLCQSTLAPSRSHLAAAKWIISRRGCRLPPLRDRIHIHHPPALARRCPRALPRAPPLDLGSRTVRTKRLPDSL